MATRKTPAKTARKVAARKAPAKRPARSRRAKPVEAEIEVDTDLELADHDGDEPSESAPRRGGKALSQSERDRRFNTLLQTTCLKAGTAAAIATITSKVPFLGRLAPVILGSVGETLALSKIQQQLVRDVIALYEVELSEPEERGVILLATAARIGAKHLSKVTVDQLVRQLGGLLYRPVLARVLPLASVASEISAAVASTYAVGKRAQALCKLPGTGARDLSELLRGLSGIDQTRLFKWSGEALSLALKPFRGALSALIPGFR